MWFILTERVAYMAMATTQGFRGVVMPKLSTIKQLQIQWDFKDRASNTADYEKSIFLMSAPFEFKRRNLKPVYFKRIT